MTSGPGYTLQALLSPANAVARIWFPLAPFDPTVQVAASFAAKLMVGPGSFFHVIRAWGSVSVLFYSS